MRKLFVLVLLGCAPALFAATTLEVRSALHAMTIDVEGEGETREYAVRVTDHETGALLVNERLRGTGPNTQATIEVDDRILRIHVGETGFNITASLLVQVNGQTIDSINASWLTKKRGGPALVPTRGLPLRVGGDVRAPVLISRVEPRYPEEARAARVAGIVIVETVIGRDGDVKDVRVLKPLPFGLDQAAVDAVKQWKFRPGTCGGEPVDVLFNLTVDFKLSAIEEP